MSSRTPNINPAIEHISGISERLRNRVVDLAGNRVRVANFIGTDQENDLTDPPNCEGFGRIRHFRRCSNSWLNDPLPMDPACAALGLEPCDMLKAQVFQIAACNFSCWYCFVPVELISADAGTSGWLPASQLVEMYTKIADPPSVIDLSGGHPELAPEWVIWMMEELRIRGLDERVYLWSDDNLSVDYVWRFLSEPQMELLTSYRNYSKVCCLKGYDSESFAFNTGRDPILFDNQLILLSKYLSLGIDLYAYVTFTTSSTTKISDRMQRFLDALQSLDYNLPLRTVPLEIKLFSPVRNRVNMVRQQAITNQYVVAEAWQRELERRYSSTERAQKIQEVRIARRAG